jgi:protein gp37
MSTNSGIEWTEATWNPTTGCDRTSPGCDNCYALTLAKRLKAMGSQKYQADGDPRTSGPGFRLTVHDEALDIPAHWRAPRMIFVDSMSDLFHPDVPLDFIKRVFAVMESTPRHTFQVLTKRSKRLAKVAPELPWPSNIWMGVSVESAKYAFRIEHLRSVGATVRFVSAEPLLGPMEQLQLDGIDWLIAGGESGPGARPVDSRWVRSLRDQCREAHVPFFFKQWGGRTPKAGGRELDGAIYSELPPSVAS